MDGTLKIQTTDAYSTFNNNEQDLLIGWSEEIHSQYSPFKGKLDEIRIYNRALSEPEAKALYLAGASLQEGLVAWWPLDGDALDASGNDNHGEIHGPVPCEDRFGNPSGALCFDGKFQDSINIGNQVKPPFPFTMSAWIKPFTVYSPGPGNIFILRNDLWGNYYHGAVVSIGNGRLVGSYGDGGFNAPRSRTGAHTQEAIMTAGDWQQVTAVFNAHRDIRLYWNCMEFPVTYGDGTGSTMRYSTANGAMGLGSPLHQPQTNYTGAIDDVRVYNRSLLPEEIMGLCQAGPGWFGDVIQTRASHEFSVEHATQKTESIRLFNFSDVPRTATVELLNPHSELAISLQTDEVTLAPGTSETLSLQIDATATAAGVYEGILLEIAVEDGSMLYSNLTVYVTEPGAMDLPDLTLRSEDIGFTLEDPSEPLTLTATIHNRGNTPASEVPVQFYHFGTLLGETIIPAVPAKGSATTSLSTPLTASGDHLIRVVIDPAGLIPELDDTNNEASQIIQPAGDPGPLAGHILVTGNLPSTVYSNALFSLSGRAVYDLMIGGVRNTDYVVKGGSVEITIQGSDGSEWIYGGAHTNVNGDFTKSLRAPSSPGTYRIRMTVTDKTFTGTRELVFAVQEMPETPPSPPSPPCTDCSGTWSYDPSAGTWTWNWISLPPTGSVPASDVRVFSENIYFSNNNPNADEEITVFTEILYWASSTTLVADTVPINLYVTYPGEPKALMGQTVIPSLSVGAPDFGSRYVYATWKNQGEGIYLVEVEVDPSYQEANLLNNAATRAIIVGQLADHRGAIAGQVTDAWGGVENVVIRIFDADGSLLGSAATNSTGFYLVENVPLGDYQVHIELPPGHLPDTEMKTVTVVEQSVSEASFLLSAPSETALEIALSPAMAVNDLGLKNDDHTVTARVIDAQGIPQPNVPLTFVVNGVNAGATGGCDPQECATDTNGEVRFTYTNVLRIKGNDTLTAVYTNQAGESVTSQAVTKQWIMPCDLNDDGQIDRTDIDIIFTGRGLYLPGDPRDIDGDGWITVNDARACVLQCTNPNCAP